MDFGFTIAAYAVAAVLFILSLGGLSGQESAKRAVWYGIAGMAIAVLATMIGPGQGLWGASIVLIALGAAVGYQLATKVQMTQMPELVAIMHSLVGLAAVLGLLDGGVDLRQALALLDHARGVDSGHFAADRPLHDPADLLQQAVGVGVALLGHEAGVGGDPVHDAD